MEWIYVFLILYIVLIGVSIWYTQYKKNRIKEQIRGLSNNTLEMTPEEFFKMRNTSFGGRGRPSFALTQNFAGVYILHNKTKNMYYVGQGQQVLNRVNAHFTGKGNG
ncbi:MAG: GIY-YIG nuclease family protein, partial [Clostridia bacterium]|nr:GIY-YIG nuclease family protein [Clostridia bacterium]